jgi:hypothetical protein
MSGFKKPTAIIRDAKVAAYKAVGAHVPADARRGHTDRMEFLGMNLMISYKTEPSPAEKAALVAGANLATNIIRFANDEVAAVVMLRRPETALFQQVMDKHFGLIAGDTSGGYLKDNVVDKKFSVKAIAHKDRRWVLEKIRENMLSISFHLNTGMYLIDCDNAARTIRSGHVKDPATASMDEEAYVSFAKKTIDKTTWRATDWDFKGGLLAGFQNGEIHVGFSKVAGYSAISLARIIIHEATHKYLKTRDEAYAWDPAYGALSLVQALNNADSYAWAAVSLYCGSLKMDTPAKAHQDWAQCTKP